MKSHSKLTLRCFFDQLFAPLFLAGAKPKTASAYREAIAQWERRGPSPTPSLGKISKEHLLAFRIRLLVSLLPAAPRQKGLFADLPVAKRDPTKLSIATANKHIRQVNALLRKAGPESVDPQGLKVVPHRLRIQPHKARRPNPRYVEPALLESIYRACPAAEYPIVAGLAAGHWWQALLVVAFVDSFRRGGLLALRWDGIDFARREIRLDAEGDKCGEGRTKPISRLVALHLERIRPLRIGGGAERVFPWPHSERTLYRQWHAIQRAAGITQAEQIKLHDLKRASLTAYAEAGASPHALQRMGDHASLATSAFYIQPTRETRRLVDELPAPPAFWDDFGGGPEAAAG